MSEGSGSSQGSPLKSEMGVTTVSNAVVSQIAGIAAQEIEKVQMGGGASAAVGGFLQSVTGGVTGGSTSGGGNFSKGVSVEVGEEEAAVDLTMAIEYGQSIPQITESARRNVINRVESLAGLHVTEVNITVNDVQIPEERPMLQEQQAGAPRPGLSFCLPRRFSKLCVWDPRFSRKQCSGLRSVTVWTFVARLRWSPAGLTR